MVRFSRSWISRLLGTAPRSGASDGAFSIGIYTGPSVLELSAPEGIRNPVLTHRDVTDVRAVLVADPFLVRAGSRWHLFFEAFNGDARKGEIGLATSEDARAWAYERIVLAEPFHLSYPHVFAWEGRYYMIPESCLTRSVRLYAAVEFPWSWAPLGELVEGREYVDPSIFRAGDRWWLFAGEGTPPFRAEVLRLFHSERLTGGWAEHPASPVVAGDPRVARPAGRVQVLDGGRLIRFAQDCSTVYGRQVHAFEITELTPSRYRERPLPDNPQLQASGSGWNGAGMHHVDAHRTEDGRWLAAVDGQACPRV